MDTPKLLAGVGVVVAALAIDAFLIEPAWLQFTEHELALPGLPRAWQGARVVQLTDLHYGNPRSEVLFRRVVREVNRREPDLVVFTGDFVRHRRRQIMGCGEHLVHLRSRHGLVGVLGDHDFARRKDHPMIGLIENLEEAGVRLLRNESTELAGGLRVAGTDPGTRKIQQDDLDKALAGLNGALPHLLLSHSPDIIVAAAARGVPMVLSGHTHGGQVVVPFYGPPITYTNTGRAHASGWSSLGATRMYTCRGVSSHQSLRFLCRPEVAVFTLRAG